METSAPDWLSNDFLTQCLQHEEGKENVVVMNFTTSSAVPPGNNFGSTIIRVKVEYKQCVDDGELHSLSLVIKYELTGGPIKEIFEDVLTNAPYESIFYRRFIPEVNKITCFPFIPKSFFSPRFSVVILEDLKEQGFLMADRIQRLDFEHCKLYMVAAASLHAASLAIHKQNPELIYSLGKELMFCHESQSAEVFKKMIVDGFKCLDDHTENIEILKKYNKIIKDTIPSLWDMLVEAHKPSKVLNTVNQGDPWCTNMMFKYDEDKKLREVKLLDFQSLRYASPVNDVVFFIWSSANDDVRRNRIDELYHIYLEAFNSKLKELKCTEYLSYEVFMANVKLLSPLALFMAVAWLPIMYDPAPADFTPFFKQQPNEVNPFNKYYNETYCSRKLPMLFEQLELAGVFEYMENFKK